jgi:hypothetical protein
MALELVWAGLIGAGLGLDRNLRNLRFGAGACAAYAAAGVLAGSVLVTFPGPERLVSAFATAASAVAIGVYLTRTGATAPLRDRLEPIAAAAAAIAFGAALGIGQARFVGLMILISIFSLAWRSLSVAPPPQTVGAGASGMVLLEVGRRAEKSRNDDEGGQQREEQGDHEQLAHAGGAGVTGQA